MPKKRGFIVFEGIDGSGLSTHSELLRTWLQKKGYPVYWSDEPTDGLIGSLIRQILKGHTDVVSRQDILALLFAADRIWHVKQYGYDPHQKSKKGIDTALKEGNIVISNRYLLSSLAYQSGPPPNQNHGHSDRPEYSLDMNWVDLVNHPMNGEQVLVDPDLVIFLDVPPEISLKRIGVGRRTYELYENYEAAGKVYEKFNEAMKRYERWPIVRIEGTARNRRARSVESVQGEIRRKVEEYILKPEQTEHRIPGQPLFMPEETIEYHTLRAGNGD